MFPNVNTNKAVVQTTFPPKKEKVNKLEKLFESFFCFFSLVYSQTSTSAIQGPTTVMLMLHVITLLVPLTAPVSTDLAEMAKNALVTIVLSSNC